MCAIGTLPLIDAIVYVCRGCPEDGYPLFESGVASWINNRCEPALDRLTTNLGNARAAASRDDATASGVLATRAGDRHQRLSKTPVPERRHRARPPRRPPSGLHLVIDLDRALLRTEPLHERLFAILKARPLAIPGLAAAALRGRAVLEMAAVREASGEFRLAACPIRAAVENLVAEATARGRGVTWLSRETSRGRG